MPVGQPIMKAWKCLPPSATSCEAVVLREDDDVGQIVPEVKDKLEVAVRLTGAAKWDAVGATIVGQRGKIAQVGSFPERTWTTLTVGGASIGAGEVKVTRGTQL